MEMKEMVAIKVVRGIKNYHEAAMTEVEVLQLLGKYDKNGSRLVWFLFCLVSAIVWYLPLGCLLVSLR